MKLHFGHRKPPDKSCIVEMWTPVKGIAIGAKSETIEFARARRTRRHAFVWTIEDASVDELAVSFGLDGEMAVAVVLMDCGPIANAPVDQTVRYRLTTCCRFPIRLVEMRHIGDAHHYT